MPKTYPKHWFWVVKLSFFMSVQGAASMAEPDSAYSDTTTKLNPYPSGISVQEGGYLPVMQTKVRYDPVRDVYLLYFYRHSFDTPVPVLLTRPEYLAYTAKRIQHVSFKSRIRNSFLSGDISPPAIPELLSRNRRSKRLQKTAFDFRVKGRARINTGIRQTHTQNPSLPVRSRKQTSFDFDEKIRLNMHAGIGEKFSFDLNYDTESLLEHERKKIRLAYTGDEDEIIRSIEMGEVQLTPYNSLIKSSRGLFGIKADLQFGKLRINSVIAQQETESRRITSGGNIHRKEFQMPIDQYDENQHFFLSHYFYHQYDEVLRNLPYINSAVRINRIEVWITNRERKQEHTRNLIAFAGLGESESPTEIPFNQRNIQQLNQSMGSLESGKEFEKLENARLLDASEYRVNEKLGYISLERPLLSGEVLGVAFEYSYKGSVYQVGEFSTDHVQGGTTSALLVNLLRGTYSSPALPVWRLMMKNIYSLPALTLEKEHFRLDIIYRHDSAGIRQPYFPEIELKDKTLLQLMSLDRLDRNQRPNPDGLYDFIEGYTVIAEKGKIIFPITEPFGRHLKNSLQNNRLAEKYMFCELYDSTLVYARQRTEKNKYILKGEYRGTSATTLSLGMIGITPGTVRVISAGVTLYEQTDYTVDYTTGMLTILNESVLTNGNGIEVTVDNQSVFTSRRKTLLGLDLDYSFSKNFSAGATIMRFSERASQYKPTLGDELVNNTVWGVHFNYNKQDTSVINRINSFRFNFRKPLEISLNGEFAQLIPGKIKPSEYGDYTWLDDFESARGQYDLSDPYLWHLPAVPWHDVSPLFPEASRMNDIMYGKNRALLAWYRVDGIFTRKQSSAMPTHLRNDKEQLSNHYVRAITYRELYPAKESSYMEGSEIPVLNLAFYPEERGPYNLDADGMTSSGKLNNPTQRWGGVMRKLDWADFESANIGTIEFWLLDPFIYDDTAKGGELYINLGEVSEDILKDGKKFFENGLPVDGDLSRTETTAWGRVSIQQGGVYAFDNSSVNRKLQDVGLNGLSSDEEKTFPAYRDYLEKVTRKVSPETLRRWESDLLSPLHDPAGDSFHHFRGSDYDHDEVDILSRYKRYNGTEGNSVIDRKSSESYDVSAKASPDTEDINGDNLLNENERYFEYKISLRSRDMEVGKNYITDIRIANVLLENGKTEEVRWYQFKIPVSRYSRRIGTIPDFRSVRFMRLYLTGWEQPVVLRFASFGLVRSEWRTYQQPDLEPSLPEEVEITTVSLEENSDRTPVNYVLPPGVIRHTDPSKLQQVRHNEQALSLKVKNLQPEEIRSIYKEVSLDIRRYRRLQLFVHAEALPGNESGLQNEDISLFLRLGSDHRNNYYEYELPLVLTPEGKYNTYHQPDQQAVWPARNFPDISLPDLLRLKQNRNGMIKYSEPAPGHPANLITVCGQPSLGDIQVVMIGIRNRSSQPKDAEVWVNELRVTGYEDKGGWAIKGSIHAGLSDLGTVLVTGGWKSAGFGAADQSLFERGLDDFSHYTVATSLQLGTLLPDKLQVRIPFNYSYYKEVSKPYYNPFDPDIRLDSTIQEARDRIINKTIAFNGVNVGIRSRVPMPYDPANFTFSYFYTLSNRLSPEIAYENTCEHRAAFEYLYQPPRRAVTPFSKFPSGYLRQLTFYYLPMHISFSSLFHRHYYEIENRSFPVSFSQLFTWSRSFELRWNFTRHLQTTFRTGTRARIEEPHTQVNRKLNPDRYQAWKDSVRHSLLHWGKPLVYDQEFKVIYHLPFSVIKSLTWLQGVVGYDARYNWEWRGDVTNAFRLGNRITNQQIIRYQGGANLINLYNKNQYFRSLNTGTSGTSLRNRLMRLGLFLRRINVVYEKIRGMNLPGFRPGTGDLLGQKRVGGEWTPGLKFAFGSVKPDFVEKALQKDWLLYDPESGDPAVITWSAKQMIQAVLEPLAGLRIELSADRVVSKSMQIEYFHEGLPRRYGGVLTTSAVGIRSFFKPNSMQQFRGNRESVANSIEIQYRDIVYPSGGFLEGTPYAGQLFRPGTVRYGSADVLIPAFLSAYTGREGTGLCRPNWRVTYDGLLRVPFIKDIFQAFLLSHQYRGVYHIPPYSSYLNRVEAGNGKGFIPLSSSDASPTPSSAYYLTSVSLSDGFTPLLGIDGTLHNQITISTHYHTSRHLNLSIGSGQLTESRTREFRLGIGYKTMELHKVFPRLRRKRERDELNIRIDYSFRKQISTIHKIEEEYSQPNTGHSSGAIHFIADYTINRLITLNLYFDWEKDIPVLSETSYPVTMIRGGVGVAFNF